MLAQPKQRGRRAAARPLAELGEDPITKREVVVRSGRFGLYVTDGETNATLRLGDAPETMTLDRAAELLAERRNAEPSTRPRKVAKKTTKKAPTKSATKTVKKSTKKSTKKTTKKTTTSTTKSTGAAKRAAVAQGAQVNAAMLKGVADEDDA